MNSLEREKDSLINRISQDAFELAVQKTPIDQGQARAGWRREDVGKEVHIVNRVPYIGQLERGRSTQAPSGILGPVAEEISRKYK